MDAVSLFVEELETTVGLALKDISFVGLVDAGQVQNTLLDVLNSSKRFKGKLDDIRRN